MSLNYSPFPPNWSYFNTIIGLIFLDSETALNIGIDFEISTLEYDMSPEPGESITWIFCDLIYPNHFWMISIGLLY